MNGYKPYVRMKILNFMFEEEMNDEEDDEEAEEEY